jgi:hypothetical protein
MINVTAVDVVFGEVAVVNVILPDDASGELNLTVGDKSYSRYIGMESGVFEIAGLDAGTYDVNVVYAGDFKYLPGATSTVLRVNKADSTVSVGSDKAAYECGETVILTISIGDATGPVSVYLDGEFKANVTTVGGAANYELANLNVGNYTVDVIYNGDSNHLAGFDGTAFTVNKIESVATVSVEDISYGDDASINVNMGNITGSVSVYVNGEYRCNVTVNNGVASYDLSDLGAGEYSISIYYAGNDKYLPVTASTTFKVAKNNQTMDISAEYAEINGTGQVLIKLPDDASGYVSVYVNNQLAGSAPIKDGFASYELSGLQAGSYKISVSYNGDDNYAASLGDAEFSVEKDSPKINVIAKDTSYGQTANVDVSLPKDATGSVNVKVGEKPFTGTLVNGAVTIPVNGLAVGTYDIHVSYEGDSTYAGSLANTTLTVVKANPNLVVIANDAIYGDAESVVVNLPADATGNVIFTLYWNDEAISNSTSALSKGTASAKFSNLELGVYKVNVQYSGDSNYLSDSKSKSFTLRPIIHITQNVTVGEDVRITMDLNDATGKIMISVDDEPMAIETIQNGKIDCAFSTENMTARNHNVTFQYFGNSFDANVLNNFDEKTKTYSPKIYDLYLSPKKISISEEYSSSDDGIVIVEVPENATGVIEIYVDGMKAGVVEIVNGIAKINMSTFKKGTYSTVFKYSGDDVYEGFTKNLMVTVNVKVSKITASNFKVVYTSKDKYSVKVYDNDGKLAKGIKVTFLIGGKVYGTATSNNKGVASISISKTPGSYKITSKAYLVNVTKTLTVKHLVSLKKVTVKKSAKSLVLTATLAKVNKKYLKNKKITFKFNGKKYTAKTNKKGVAKVTIKSSVLKKLKVNKKITYQATYLKDTVTLSVKVKK